MGESTDRVRAVFEVVADLEPHEREQTLRRACGEDESLLNAVRTLLRALDDAGAFLDPIGRPPAGPDPAATGERPGDVIGRYRLLEEIGQGGFGTVYLAAQSQPVRRWVALKIVKLGMDSAQVVARFEQERQALAVMDHPNIARVIDGGTTETGRPYFVMELVRGVTITEYCDAARLDTTDRLRLFVPVCRAIHHAHQKGVIHRDIKPSNVLVTLVDGEPVPKVIDFGVAKAVDRTLTERSLYTEFRQVIGTPAYMSPEQAGLSAGDVDTRADVYSLGVLLYELLTGTTPFDVPSLMRRGYDEMLRIIREEGPPRPSTRISTLGQAATAVAAARRIAPRLLSRLLSGDLDWIVMRTLDKDRRRRYESAASLAADVGRFLTHAPVEARRPTVGYRLRKYVRRHRVGVGAALVLLVALGAGVAAAIAGRRTAMREAEIARDEETTAIARRAEAEREAAVWAERRADAERAIADARLVTDLVEDVLDPPPTGERRPPDWPARELVEEVAERLDHGIGSPWAEGTLLQWVMQWHTSQGEYERAIDEADRAVAAFRRLQEPPLDGIYGSLIFRAFGTQALGRPRETQRILDGLKTADPPPNFLVRANVKALESKLLGERGDWPGAVAAAREAVEIATSGVTEANRHRVLEFRAGLVNALSQAGRLEEAMEELRRVFADESARERNPVSYAHALVSSAESLRILRKWERAREQLERALAIFESSYGPDSPVGVTAWRELSLTLSDLGRMDEAVAAAERAWKLSERSFGPDHRQTLTSRIGLPNALYRAGRLAEAEGEAKALLARLEPTASARDRAALFLMLARIYRNTGRRGESIEATEEAVRLLRALDPRPPDFAEHLGEYAISLYEGGRVDDALRTMDEVIAILEAQGVPDDRRVIAMRLNAVSFSVGAARLKRAAALLAEIGPKLDEIDAGPADRARYENFMASVALGEGRSEDYFRHMERAVELERGWGGPHLPSYLAYIVQQLVSHGRLEEADRRFPEWLEALPPDRQPLQRVDALARYSRLLQMLGDPERGEQVAREGVEVAGAHGLSANVWAVRCRVNLACALLARGRGEEADEEIDRLVAFDGAANTLVYVLEPTWLEAGRGDLEAALRLPDRLEPRLPDDSPLPALERHAFFVDHANLLVAAERWADVERVARRAVAAAAEVGQTSPDGGVVLGLALLSSGKPEEALAPLRMSLEQREASLPAGSSWPIASARSLLGEALAALDRTADAEPVLRQAWSEIEALEDTDAGGAPPARRRRLAAALARTLAAAGEDEEAAEFRRIAGAEEK